MIPVILLGGILTGWFTPTEAGVVAVVWIIAGRDPALNRGHIKRIPYDFCLAGLIFSLPLITIGAANAFGWMLAYLRGADRHRRLDHLDRRQRSASDHAAAGAAVHRSSAISSSRCRPSSSSCRW